MDPLDGPPGPQQAGKTRATLEPERVGARRSTPEDIDGVSEAVFDLHEESIVRIESAQGIVGSADEGQEPRRQEP